MLGPMRMRASAAAGCMSIATIQLLAVEHREFKRRNGPLGAEHHPFEATRSMNAIAPCGARTLPSVMK